MSFHVCSEVVSRIPLMSFHVCSEMVSRIYSLPFTSRLSAASSMNYKLMDCISDVVSRMILLSFHVSHPSKIVRSTALLLPWLWLHASSPAGEESPGGGLAWPRRHTPWEHRPVVPGHTAPSAGTTCSGLRRAGVARSLPGGSTATSPPCAPGSRRLASRAWPDSLTPPSRDGRPRQASTSPRRSRRASATGPAPAALVQPAGRSSSAALRAPPTPRRSVTRQDDAHGQPGPGALHAWPTPAPATRPGPRNNARVAARVAASGVRPAPRSVAVVLVAAAQGPHAPDVQRGGGRQGPPVQVPPPRPRHRAPLVGAWPLRPQRVSGQRGARGPSQRCWAFLQQRPQRLPTPRRLLRLEHATRHHSRAVPRVLTPHAGVVRAHRAP